LATLRSLSRFVGASRRASTADSLFHSHSFSLSHTLFQTKQGRSSPDRAEEICQGLSFSLSLSLSLSISLTHSQAHKKSSLIQSCSVSIQPSSLTLSPGYSRAIVVCLSMVSTRLSKALSPTPIKLSPQCVVQTICIRFLFLFHSLSLSPSD
jgi:hypothetical protein